MRLGVDLEQYVADPQSSGIQRVLQQLARTWPSEIIEADFVVPSRDGSRACFALLTAQEADSLISMAFESEDSTHSLRERVLTWVESQQVPKVSEAELMAMYDAWLVPEVSYLPTVLQRAARFQSSLPTTMIAYDVLPMIDPGNYRFIPGTSAQVSEYFRLLAEADALLCISEWTRSTVLRELRRDPTLVTEVASPGGDHVELAVLGSDTFSGTPRYVRVGTLEERKQPLAILEAFRSARSAGAQGELAFIGRASASHAHINESIRSAADDPDSGVTWIDTASDEEIRQQVADSDAFLSFGVEGFGIPVLEALRWGTPVLYSGIQPAAELMEGKGATRIHELSDVFSRSSQQLAEMRVQIDTSAIPTWRDFSLTVAKTIMRSMP